MDDFKSAVKDKIVSVIDSWDESGIYAISFFVYSNAKHEYNGFSNVVNFSISYNTKSDCPLSGKYSERRWNHAYWRQNETPILYTDEQNPLTDLLFEWYREQGLNNIGEEVENGRYIGKGPEGHYELLTLLSEIAAELQNDGFLAKTFGKPLPIIIHGLEYAWYDIEATKRGNPNGEADDFLRSCKKHGYCE